MEKQLEKMVDIRLDQAKNLIGFIWEHRKEILAKQASSESFRSNPEAYIPNYLYDGMGIDFVNRFNDFLYNLSESGARMTKRELINIVIPVWI